MNFGKLFYFSGSVLFLALSACGNLNAVKDFKASPLPPAERSMKPSPQLEYHDGGAPGSVMISGAVVQEINGKPELKDKISVDLKGGIGISGSEYAFNKSDLLKYSTKLDDKSQFKSTFDNSIIAVGCDSRIESKYAQGGHLTPATPVKDSKTLTISLNADTVVLCGDVDFEFQFVAVNANRLVLMNMNYRHIGWMQVTRFSTNNLEIVGTNKVTIKASDNENTLPLGGFFILEAAKKFVAADQDSLKIESIGSNYLKPKK